MVATQLWPSASSPSCPILAARGTRLTNSSSVYAEPCAQQALAFMLAEARQLGRSLGDAIEPLSAWAEAWARER